MKIVDLTVTLNSNTPVYPGDPVVKIEPAGVLEKDGFNDHLVSVGTHVGTHIDAPFHMLAEGKKLSAIPVENFVGRGRYVRAGGKEIKLEAFQHADIQEGDIVLIHTDWNNLYGEESYFEDYPEIPEDAAQYLVEKKIKMVGMDMCGPDHEPFKTHKIFLNGGVLIVENLTNVDKLAGKEFTVHALPIKLELDGAPARVIATLKH